MVPQEPLIKQSPLIIAPVPIVLKTLTVDECRKCTTKGLCFNCDESYSPGHKCKGHLFCMDAMSKCLDAMSKCLVEVLDESHAIADTEEVLEPGPASIEISLHTFSGTYNPRTIRVTRWVDGRPLTILVDSGSTHNFVQNIVVRKLGIPVEPLPAFDIFIGSGKFLVCREVCRQVTVILKNVVLTEDLFVLGMGGANVVLGIQWLEKLGSMTMNHKDLTIEFGVGD